MSRGWEVQLLRNGAIYLQLFILNNQCCCYGHSGRKWGKKFNWCFLRLLMTRDFLIKRIAEAARKKSVSVSSLSESEVGDIGVLLKDLRLELFGISPDQLKNLVNSVE